MTNLYVIERVSFDYDRHEEAIEIWSTEERAKDRVNILREEIREAQRTDFCRYREYIQCRIMKLDDPGGPPFEPSMFLVPSDEP